jgi:hypothetical protein
MAAVADEWRRRQGDAVMEDTSTLPVPIGAEIARPKFGGRMRSVELRPKPRKVNSFSGSGPLPDLSVIRAETPSARAGPVPLTGAKGSRQSSLLK